MPNSMDNQDLKKDDTSKDALDKNSTEKNGEKQEFTSDDLKGKKVDADPTKESDKPAETN